MPKPEEAMAVLLRGAVRRVGRGLLVAWLAAGCVEAIPTSQFKYATLHAKEADALARVDDAAVELPAGAKTHKVATKGFAFDPVDLTIAAGDSVEFAPGPSHTATQVSETTWNANGSTPLAGGFDVSSPTVKTVLFDKAGLVHYVCIPHAGGGMKGKITVK